MKALSVVAVVTAVYAALAAIVFTSEFLFAVMPVLAVAAGILAIVHRTRTGVLAGISLIVIALFGLFLVFGSLTFEGGSGLGDPEADAQLGFAFGLAVGLLVPGAVAALRWEDVRPAWLPAAAGAAVLIGWIVTFVALEGIGLYWRPANYIIALAALVAAAPAVMLLRGSRRPEPRPVPP